MPQLPCAQIQGPCQILLGVLAWGHDEFPGPFGDPGIADVGEQMAIARIRQHHHVSRSQTLEMQPDTGQACDPLGVGIFGDQLGAFPHPAEFVEPAPHGLCRPPDPMLGRQLRCQRAQLQRVRHQP